MAWLRSLLAMVGMVFVTSVIAGGSQIEKEAVASAEWIAKALTVSGYKADFSIESLREVDRFFDEQVPDGHARPDGLLSRDVGARLFALGSYVGEVIRRASGGEWQGDDKDPRAEINIALRLKDGTTLWPVQRVMKRFKNGREDGVYVYGFVATHPDSAR